VLGDDLLVGLRSTGVPPDLRRVELPQQVEVVLAPQLDAYPRHVSPVHVRRPLKTTAPTESAGTGSIESSTKWLRFGSTGPIVNHMVEDPVGMDAVFHALAHGARRTMLRRLAERELTVGELAEPLAMSLAAASKHVQVLERAGLVRRTVTGRRHVCRLEAAPLASAQAWLTFYEHHWNERLDALEALFTPDDEEKR
jgi:DNA-binding transcriptional ArsR family regulator